MSTNCVQMCIIRSKLTVISEFCISFSRSRLYLLYNWEDRLPNTILVSGTDLEYRLSLPYPVVLIGGTSYYFCYDHTSAERNNDMLCRFVMIYYMDIYFIIIIGLDTSYLETIGTISLLSIYHYSPIILHMYTMISFCSNTLPMPLT